MDIEEWYHLQYLQRFNISTNLSVIDGLHKFMDLLDLYNVKCTFFLVAELAKKYKSIILRLIERGHELGCHSLNHNLPLNQSVKDFRSDLKLAKNIIENEYGVKVNGYRAPCFNLNDEYLKVVQELEFRYDSSFILSKINKKYGALQLNSFKKVENLIYTNSDKFYEFEIPVLRNLIFKMPISGTGYMRLLNNYFLNLFVKQYLNQNMNFLIYTHPYEFSKENIKLPKDIELINKFKFTYGKKTLDIKIMNLFELFKNNSNILTMSSYLNDIY
jgi:hypothetical protein